jgi:hypothetical protein
MARTTAPNPLYQPRYNDPSLAAASQNIAGLLLGGQSPNERAAMEAQAALLAAQTGSAAATGRKTDAEARMAELRTNAFEKPWEYQQRQASLGEAFPNQSAGMQTMSDILLGGALSGVGDTGKARRANEMSNALDIGHLDFAGPLGVQPGDVAERTAALEGKDLVNQTDNVVGSKFRREQPLVTRLGEAEIGKRKAEAVKIEKGPQKTKMPATVLKAYTEHKNSKRAAEAANKTIAEARNLVKGGSRPDGSTGKPLDVTPTARLAGAAEQALGEQFGASPSENSRGLKELQRIRERMRNDYLLLAKGVQTEGDALRAINGLMPDTNDPKEIENQIEAVARANDELAARHQETMDLYEATYEIPDVGQGKPLTPGAPAVPGYDADKERRYQEWKARQGAK